MSEEKRAQLIAEGKLNPDGTRKLLCPVCQTELDQQTYDTYVAGGEGSAVAEVTTHDANVEA